MSFFGANTLHTAAVYCSMAMFGCFVWSNVCEAFTPAIVYDVGGRFDKSFNQAALEGSVRFELRAGLSIGTYEIEDDQDRDELIALAVSEGSDFLILIGFNYTAALMREAPKHPHVRFTIIDGVVEEPNVKSVLFRENEGSFLVGALAAMVSQSGIIGFVGGMDIPVIRHRFLAGYVAGARHVRNDIRVVWRMTGTTPMAFMDPFAGALIAFDLVGQGADVIYAAAGSTGLGVYMVARESRVFAIGVDSDQTYLHPGTMLTSMVKRVDLAVEQTFLAGLDGTWKPGIVSLGLRERGVDYAVNSFNQHLIQPEWWSLMETIRTDIVAGRLVVDDRFRDE